MAAAAAAAAAALLAELELIRYDDDGDEELEDWAVAPENWPPVPEECNCATAAEFAGPSLEPAARRAELVATPECSL